jgi:hypothetical protein
LHAIVSFVYRSAISFNDLNAEPILLEFPQQCIVDIPRSACLKDVRSRSPRSRTVTFERMMREKCGCTTVQSGPWMVPKPNTAWSLGSASWLAKLSELARKLTAALSTGHLDDATGSIDDAPAALPMFIHDSHAVEAIPYRCLKRFPFSRLVLGLFDGTALEDDPRLNFNFT